MNISRGALLARLNEAKAGLSAKETVEQSSCFVFSGVHLTTYNETVMVRVPNPLKELCGEQDIVCAAHDLITILSRFPDDEVVVKAKPGELWLKGKTDTAGINYTVDVALPLDEVPAPDKWNRLGEGMAGLLQQAARTCGDNAAQYLTTVVHVTPEMVEACDNYRLFRAACSTGFQSLALISAEAVAALEGLELSKVCVGNGWVHFKTASAGVVSVRCSHDEFTKGLDAVLAVEKGQKVVLPANLGEIVQRAEVFNSGGYDARIQVSIGEGQLTIKSRKEGGWFKGKRGVEYNGPPLEFEVNPKFLVELLGRTREVIVDTPDNNRHKLKVANGNIQFVAVIYPPKEDSETPPEPSRKAPAQGKAPPGKKKALPENPIGNKRQFTEADIPF